MKRLMSLVAVLVAVSCATPLPPPDEVLTPLPSAFVTPSPPIDPEVSPFLVNVTMNGQGPFAMLVDTGSTQSAIFAGAAARLGKPLGDGNEINVRGLSSIEQRPIVRDIDLEMGPFRYDSIDLVGLPNRIPPRFDGIIGTDILQDFVMMFEANERFMVFVPRKDVPEDAFDQWILAETIPPPSGNENFNLAFVRGLIGPREVTVLIDSGTSLSVASWETALFNARVRLLRNQLRRQWQLEGANSPFRPRALIKLENFRIETFSWEEPLFLLSDLSTLDVLGADTEPFMIIGIDLLGETSFAFDVTGGKVWFAPNQERSPSADITAVAVPIDR